MDFFDFDGDGFDMSDIWEGNEHEGTTSNNDGGFFNDFDGGGDMLGGFMPMLLLAGGGLLASAFLGGGPSGVMSWLPFKPVNSQEMQYDGNVSPIQPYQFPNPYHDGRVKGLFIGINYFGQAGELRGCINDVTTMLSTLRDLEFPLQEACILVDDSKYGGRSAPPTRAAIINHFLWLVHDARPGDVLFLHYSGHGSQAPNTKGEEESGMDGTLVPLDHENSGCIVDDDIFNILCKNLPTGVRMTAIMDCCHSGTLMDLPYTFACTGNDTNPGRWRMKADKFIKQSEADVVMFAGCADSQTSADAGNTAALGNKTGQSGGACTNALAMVLKSTSGLTAGQLLINMRNMLRREGYDQVPQLGCSKPMDLNRQFSLFGPVCQGAYIPYHGPPPNAIQPYPFQPPQLNQNGVYVQQLPPEYVQAQQTMAQKWQHDHPGQGMNYPVGPNPYQQAYTEGIVVQPNYFQKVEDMPQKSPLRGQRQLRQQPGKGINTSRREAGGGGGYPGQRVNNLPYNPNEYPGQQGRGRKDVVSNECCCNVS